MNRMIKVGIKDVAAGAGVSIATVSHAFRNPGRVSKATRLKVLRVADDLGYSPNNLAVSLRTARSGNIVVIIPDVAGSHNSDIIKSMENVAHDRGYSVLLGDTQGSEAREKEFGAMTLSRQADGIILMSHRLPFNLEEENWQVSTLPPLVNGCEFTGHDEVPLVAIDDMQAASDATRHLLEYGHTDIAVITGNMSSPSSQNRLKGFRLMMKEAGLDVADRQVIFGDYTLEGGELATRQLLLHKNRPTAIFCFSDEIALGCMSVLRTSGFHVPDDISVMGFDNIRFARYSAPPLTTIAQPTADIGAICATILLDMIDGREPERLRNILPHELIVRESTRQLY